MNWRAARIRLLLLCSTATPLCAQIAQDEGLVALFDSPAKPRDREAHDGYTINYNTISIIEYIRFASKICNLNFIYSESDLNFNVSVVSDAPITPENVMATLIQVLRINGLMLIEQDNNLVIHKTAGVKQLATLVTDGKQEGKSPIVTRIFRVKNTKAEAIAAIIRPMISTEALLETSQETRQLILTDVTANVDKVAALIEILDSPHTPLEIKSYEVQHNTPEFLIEMANQIMTPLAQGNPFILVAQPLANSVFIVSTPELIERATATLASLDTIPKREAGSQRRFKSENVFLYKAMNRSGSDLLQDMRTISDDLSKSGVSDGDLLDTIKSGKYIPDSNSLMFVGSNGSVEKVKEFLATLDVWGADGKSSFLVYKPQTKSAQDLEKSVLEMAHNLKGSDEGLVDALRSVRVNASSNMLVFSGAEKDLAKIKELLATIDASNGKSNGKGGFANTLFVYKPKSQSGESLASSLKEVYETLKSEQYADPGLLQTLRSMKWVKANNSLLFTGDAASIKKLEELIATMDGASKGNERTFFLYHPQEVTQTELQDYLDQVAENLAKKGVDESLVAIIRSKKWIEPSQSFLFQGKESSFPRLKELLTSFDVTTNRRGARHAGYFLYKLQNTTGDIIEEDLDSVAKNLSASGIQDSRLVDVIEHMRYVKETNSLLLTGDPKGIEEAKALIAEYDYARIAIPKGDIPSSFILYKPLNSSAGHIEKSLREVASNLKKADLADPSLLATIESSRYVEATNSIVFTGPPDALKKLQTLLKDVDVPPQARGPIQHVGNTTFLLYKPKNASGCQLLCSIRTMCCDLKKSGATDKEFLCALQNAKYVKESCSLLFTGTEDALKKVEPFVTQLDLSCPPASEQPAQSATGATNFIVYRPTALPAPDLEKIMQDFTENLKSGGLSDPDLFAALASMNYLEPTQSLVFTGNPKALDQIKQLLTSFDIPSNAPNGPGQEPSIQAIENTSFLVYKLQFHKGEEIQGALRQIAKDLINTNAPINQNLLNSINSIQWLDVTNSLLCSGDQETLVRLRELIKNLDVPLKQVYIEMLVIETTLDNALQFGLEWGGKYKYRNKFQGSFNNTSPTPNNATDSTMTALNNLIPSIPMPSTLASQIAPPNGNFDLGIIGQVIKHNGQTFLTLGSLLNALQQDVETSVIITPKIIAQDGHTSTVFHGQNIPFVGSFVSNTGSNATVQTSNLEYRDVGVNLTITPVLGNSDIVTLDISLDRTNTLGDVTGASINFNQSTAQGITTSRTTMQTTVHVPDRNFLILSGFVNNSNVKAKAGIPCLGGLPLIGAAFSKDNNTVSNANLVIFLRPHIINSVDDLRQLTRDQEEAFRDQQGTPFLIKQFDDGMEMIKSIDDE